MLHIGRLSALPRTVMFIVVLCVALGALPIMAQDTFYDAYEVGLSYERAGRWSQALAAFETARSLRSEPGRDVPTFGRAVLEVYDPDLHLARVKIELGRGDEAVRDLDRARSNGVSSASEIEALVARLGISGRGPAPTEKPTDVPTVLPDPTRAPTRGAALATREPTKIPPTATSAPATEVPTPVPTANAVAATDAPAKKNGGGAFLLIVVVAAILVIIGVRRRRRRLRDSSEPLADYETTPTRRVDTATRGPASISSTVAAGDRDVVIGGYRVLDRLGRGGMATTYRAEKIGDGTVAALKIPHDHLLDDAEFIERFLREGALGATIHHPNIIRIFDVGREAETPFIAMELVDGETLEAKLRREGALPAAEALEISRGIALALDYAHVKGVIHRDVKPDNVMLTSGDGVKVMDFGIARVTDAPGLTATNTYLGTPLYSSPEAIDPAQVGPQSDLYSMGIVLYRMLSNRVPFEAPSPLKVVEMHCTAPLPPFAEDLGVPPAVEDMVRRLTAKKKTDRYPSAEAFLHELNGYLTGRTNG